MHGNAETAAGQEMQPVEGHQVARGCGHLGLDALALRFSNGPRHRPSLDMVFTAAAEREQVPHTAHLLVDPGGRWQGAVNH